VLLYDALLRLSPSPVVALNRAAAVAMAEGAEAGLRLLEHLSSDPDLQGYALYFAARADLERRLGRFAAALENYERAFELTKNESERRYLAKRIAAIRGLAS
jgi:RNA polymerase sigma-70 factor (ECF subfamily)